MTNLVIMDKKSRIFTTSLIYAKELGIRHKDLLEKIREMKEDLTDANSGRENSKYKQIDFESNFILSEYITNRNRRYPIYEITENGFLYLMMNTSARGAHLHKLNAIQWAFIQAFNEYRTIALQELVNKKSLDWKKERLQGKIARLKMTDAVEKLVERAIKQGSTNYNRYYKLFTDVVYKTLSYIAMEDSKLRERLDKCELYQLALAEQFVADRILEYLKDEEFHYKAIRPLVKKELEEYVDTFYIGGVVNVNI